MEKILLIPDSFKGSMNSGEICAIMKKSILPHYPAAQIIAIPVADGGEGSVDAFLGAVGGERVLAKVQGPYGEEIESFYGILPDGTAVVEMAAAAGLPLVEGRPNPSQTSTYGVGQLVLHAAHNGAKRILLGLGGSCTNDMAAGMAAAMGVRFTNPEGKSFVPTGESLDQIAAIDLAGLDPVLRGLPVTAMCDIDNPLYGKNGAAYVFSPQKGADAAMVAALDKKMKKASEVIQRQLGKDIAHMPGAGAAGGMGGGVVAFFNAKLQMGIEAVLDIVQFDTLLEGADLVLTGEGKLDKQTLAGKVVVGVARRAKQKNVPVIAIVGDVDDDVEAVYDEGVTGIFSINRVARNFEQVRGKSKQHLALAIHNLMRTLKRFSV